MLFTTALIIGFGVLNSHTEEDIKVILESTSGPYLPELGHTDLEVLRNSSEWETLRAWYRNRLSDIPTTSYTDYRIFQLTGAREPYQEPYFAKRAELNRATLAVWLGGDDAALDRVNDLVWNICEETTWSLPAHEVRHGKLDLFASETAAELAHVDLVLGDRLPEEIRNRIRSEVEGRIFTPYLANPDGYGWGNGSSNWTGVCAGAIGQTFLLLENDIDRKAQALALVLEQLYRYIDNAFTPEGASLEGIGYWNYGLIHYVVLAEMLRSRTDGAIDLLAHEKIPHIARFPEVMALDHEVFANFADSRENAQLEPFIVNRLAERTNANFLPQLAGSVESWRFVTTLRNILWSYDGDITELQLSDAFFPDAGIGKLVHQNDDHLITIAVKAGHNAEQHNNNDIGSFIVRINGDTFLCDPGAGRYSRDYFGPNRYKNIFANSYGHSVPVINGQLQPPGSQYKGTLSRNEEGAFIIRFEQAYAVPELTKLERIIAVVDDKTITLSDTFEFEGEGLPVQTAFVTWQQIEADGNTARIEGKNGTLLISSPEVIFAVEHLEEASRDNHKREVLKRLTVDFSEAPVTEAIFTMTYMKFE